MKFFGKCVEVKVKKKSGKTAILLRKRSYFNFGENYFFALKLSLRVTVRLKTIFFSVESGSTANTQISESYKMLVTF